MKGMSKIALAAVAVALSMSAVQADTTVTFDDQYPVLAGTPNVGWGYFAPVAGSYTPTVAPGITASFAAGPITAAAIATAAVELAKDPNAAPVSSTLSFLKYNDLLTASWNDHTSNGTSLSGVNIYSAMKWDEANSSIIVTFSGPVTVPSLWVTTLAGSSDVTVTGYNGATPMGSQTVTPSGHGYFDNAITASFREVTALAGIPVTSLNITGYFAQLDDMTVAAVPEPTSLGLLGTASLLMMRRRRASR